MVEPPNQDEWRRWIADHAPKLLLFARQMARSEADAQDLVQEALVECWQRNGARTPPLPLLFATVRRRAIDLARREDRRMNREQAVAGNDTQPWFDPGVEQREFSRMIQEAMSELPPEQREVITLKIWGQMTFAEIGETYRTQGVFPAMAKFGALVEASGPKYSEQQQATPPTPESQEMMERMAGNFELFIAHELPQIGSYQPNLDALRSTSTRIVSAAGEDSGEQGARRAAIALADQLGIPVTYLPGGHGGWGADRQHFADTLHHALQEGR